MAHGHEFKKQEKIPEFRGKDRCKKNHESTFYNIVSIIKIYTSYQYSKALSSLRTFSQSWDLKFIQMTFPITSKILTRKKILYAVLKIKRPREHSLKVFFQQHETLMNSIYLGIFGVLLFFTFSMSQCRTFSISNKILIVPRPCKSSR